MSGTSRGIRAGRAFVELFADDRKLVRGLRRAQRRLQAWGASVEAIGMKMLTLGGAMAAPFALSGRVFAGFDDQMRSVQAVLGATGAEFEMLSEKAKRLGRTTSYTAAEVAGAMLELARAGFDSTQIDQATDGVLNLARATGTDLATATNIAAGTLRSFGLEASEMERVGDVLTATANNSAQTLEDLGEAMKYAAPVADAYGMSLEDTSKAVGALANFSIRGSMAGNVLKNVMLKLADPSVRARLEQLGVATTDAAGGMLEASSVLRNLGGAIRSMPKADQLTLMNDLFGQRAVAGGIKLTTANFERLAEAVDHAEGTAKRTAAVMDSGIGGAMRRLWSAIEGMAIGIGEAIAKPVSVVADAISRAAGMVTEWMQNNQGLIASIGMVAAAIAGGGVAVLVAAGAIKVLALGLGALSTLAGVASTAVTALGAILGALMSPIGLVVAAVVGLGGYIVYATGAGGKAVAWLQEKFGSLAHDARASFGAIGEALAAGDIAAAAKVLWTLLKMEWEKGVMALERAWLNFRNFFIRLAYDAIYGAMKGIETGFYGLEVAWIETTAALSQAWTVFTSSLHKAWTWVSTKLEKAWNRIKGLFDEDFDADAANAAADQAYEAGMRKIDAERNRRLADRERQRQRERDDARQTHDATMDLLQSEQDAKKQALQDEYDRRMEAAQDEVDAARAEWQQAVQQAKDSAKTTPGEEPGKPSGPADGLPDYDPAALAASTAGPKTSARGTFVAANVLGLQSGNAADRMATGIEKIERNTRTLRDAEGLAFD